MLYVEATELTEISNTGKTRRHRQSDNPSLWTAKRVSGRHPVTDLEVHDGVFDFLTRSSGHDTRNFYTDCAYCLKHVR